MILFLFPYPRNEISGTPSKASFGGTCTGDYFISLIIFPLKVNLKQRARKGKIQKNPFPKSKIGSHFPKNQYFSNRTKNLSNIS